MKPLRCFSTAGLVAAVLTRISLRLRMDPCAWADIDVSDFVELTKRRRAN